MRVLVVFGTRPEAIKMAPVVRELARHPDSVALTVCVTAQHRELLDQVLGLFGIRPDIDLDLMRPGQTLPALTARVLTGMIRVFEGNRPDWVLVQGDTTTVFATALAAFYLKIPVGHVEAGLRTSDRYFPFPEEINRRLVGALATYHFAPTERARLALLSEGVDPGSIFVTGNTVVDALQWILKRPPSPEAQGLLRRLPPGKKLILVTAHRRESFGAPFVEICHGLRAVVERNPEVLVAYPVHPNPNVRGPVKRFLSGHERIVLLDPLPYEPFVRLMQASFLVLTDSGGLQEEAPVLGKPVLVLRTKTERPEAVEAGVARLIGTSRERIVSEVERLLCDEDAYRGMAKAGSLFGDGHAAERIVRVLLGSPGA
ncbi:TPA: UDP-N-acetylglucosamine 2-epimerase (non-hydrolyzing) [Candidatus Acetothermia bacterium]|nr:UDP-N-acetylglucosamine 2-epimerase (non-hydrolyzing) [Candidatus Acetothermia bacterium]